MQDYDEGTIKFSVDLKREEMIDSVMRRVTSALESKGYNPVNQLVGYIMSGDPTYITSYEDARTLIQDIERDELLEELIKRYLMVLKGL